jgi:peptide/nickel transport system permease protein
VSTTAAPAAPPPAQAAPMQGVSFWMIARAQLRKNGYAVFGFRSLVFLMLLATYAPVLASDRPFFFREGDEVSWPWFSGLFDRVEVTQTVDLFFNLLMITIPVGWIVFVLARRRLRASGRWSARAIRRTLGIVALLHLWIFAGIALPDAAAESPVGTVALAPGLLFRTAKPAVDWHDREAEARAENREVRAVFPVLPYHYDKTRPPEANLAPDWFFRAPPSDLKVVGKHPLGTDPGGKDVLAALLFGTRISMTIGVIAVAISVAIGILLGALAGFFGGWVDVLISRFIEVMLCFPVLFFVLTIVSVFESRTIFLIMAVIGFTSWPSVARLVRGEFLRERGLDYVNAARALGLPNRRTIFRHVLPNALTPVFVNATFGVAGAILTESAVAFLGLGDPTTASWGLLLNKGRQTNLEWLILAPGFAIFFTVTVFNLLGEGLRDALDPKLRA